MTKSSTLPDAESEDAPVIKKDQTFWAGELEAWKKRTRKWHKSGNKTLQKFLSDTTSDASYDETDAVFRLSFFHQHINTLMSMLYGTVPQVDVSRRHADQNDDVSRVAGLMLGRLLNTDVQTGGENFASMLRGALQDRLLPGLGTARLRYEVETKSNEVAAVYDMDGNVQTEAYKNTEIVSEEAPIDYVHWEDFAWSYARTWAEVTWVGFRTRLTKAEADKRFGKAKAAKLKYTKAKPTQEKDELFSSDVTDPQETAAIWELWCKVSKKVYWCQEELDDLLETKPDTLGLGQFFPCPPPMLANVTTKQVLPVPDYKYSQDLYNEIDLLQTRISLLTKALKVVGVYDSGNDGVQRIMEEGFENQLIPVDNWAMFAEKGGLKGVVDWFPVQDIALTLEKLRGIRNDTISLLYQVSGLQDTLSGGVTGGQPTSATEQALRARFASVRVQYLQDDFARFASNLQSIKAEVIGLHFDPQTIVERSNIVAIEADREYVEQAIQLVKQPEMAKWLIEIRPESIAMIDYAQLKSERTEYLTALSTFLQSAQAAGKVAPELTPMLLELLKWGLAGFKGSAEIEGVVDRAITAVVEAQKKQAAQPKQPSPEEVKQKFEMGKLQLEMKRDQQKQQAEAQKAWKKANDELQKMNAQLMADLKRIQAETASNIREEVAKTTAAVTKEAAQAAFNMMEKANEAKIQAKSPDREA